MQTITKWHWANRRARCWHVTTHNGKENGRNIRKWIEKMSAPCTCAPLLTPYPFTYPSLSLWLHVCVRDKATSTGNRWKIFCFVTQVRSARSLCSFSCVWVCVKVFWVICPHNRCEVFCTHTHVATGHCLFSLDASCAFCLQGHNQSLQTAPPPFFTLPRT